MKKLILLFAAVCITANVFADYSGTCGENLTWTLTTADGVLTISGTGEMHNYASGNYSPYYAYKTEIKSVIIQNGATSIGDRAFYRCTSLTSVTIPNSVTSIGNSAFHRCESLTSVTIPNSVTSIGSQAFDYTPWLDNHPDGLLYINNILYTYLGFMPENTIVIADGTVSISNSAFNDRYALKSVTIPNSVTSIGAYTFAGCNSLTSVTIPNLVTSIGNYAFAYCGYLASITSYAITPPTIYGDTFDYVNRNIPLYVPASSIDAYKGHEYWSEFNIQGITTVAVPNVTIESLYVENGFVVCPEPFEIFTISGLNVTNQNGNLSSGIYIVKTEKSVQKIMVK